MGTLLVGVPTGIATVKSALQFYRVLKNRPIILANYITPGHIYKGPYLVPMIETYSHPCS